MFYFGGMTLGYLERPAPAGASQDGEIKAGLRQDQINTTLPEKALALRDHLSRANWFNLFW